MPYAYGKEAVFWGPEIEETLFKVNLHLSLLHVPAVDLDQPGASETEGEFAVESSKPSISESWPLVSVLCIQSSGEGLP